jgi:hypothetical protein
MSASLEGEHGGTVREHRPNERRDADDQRRRQEWFFASRRKGGGENQAGLFFSASRLRREAELKTSLALRTDTLASLEAPQGSANWTPLGPSVVTNGQATNNPPVTGRIEALAVGPGGLRIYAGAANGGVWLSIDGGAHWDPLDDYAASPGFTSALEADALSVGALAVDFGATAAMDRIFVGTGEAGAGDGYFGIGVRHSPSGGAPGTWKSEATNLAGADIYRITTDPGDPAVVLAATTVGLFLRPATAPFDVWARVESGGVFTDPGQQVSDLIVAGNGASRRYYAAFVNDRVYRSPDAETWTALGGLPNDPKRTERLSLAAGESDPSVVYALASDGTLFRLAGDRFQPVQGVPGAAMNVAGTYHLVVAVDPLDANTVYLAGGDLSNGPSLDLAFYKGTIAVSGPADSPVFTFPFTNEANPAADPTYIGAGVHPDAHSLAFAIDRTGVKHVAASVWIGTDGGLFHSLAAGAKGSFAPRNTGLAILEMNYIAQRPDTDAVLFGGCQDNGSLRFRGEPAWFEAPQGDGGGMAIDPNDPYRILRQYHNAGKWTGDDLEVFEPGLDRAEDGGVGADSWSSLNFPPLPPNPTAAQKLAANKEDSATAFYSPIVTSPAGVLPTLAVFGTNRLWVTSDWGTNWVTLPTGTNPYNAPSPDSNQAWRVSGHRSRRKSSAGSSCSRSSRGWGRSSSGSRERAAGARSRSGSPSWRRRSFSAGTAWLETS